MEEKEKGNEGSEQSKSKNELIYEQTYTVLKKNFYIKLIIIAILDYISRSSNWISYAITKVEKGKIDNAFQKNITVTFDIFIRYIFSFFILKFKMYKHRILSLIMSIIGFSLLIINDIILIKGDSGRINWVDTIYFTAIVSINSITYPLEDTIIKQIFFRKLYLSY